MKLEQPHTPTQEVVKLHTPLRIGYMLISRDNLHDLSKRFALILVSCEYGKNPCQSLRIFNAKLADVLKLGTLKPRTHE